MGALGCWGSLWVGRLWGAPLGGCWVAPMGARVVGHWAAPLGTRDALGVGGHWAPLGAGGPHGWVGSGISFGGRWAAPLGAGTHVGRMGVGCPHKLGVCMGRKALGRTLVAGTLWGMFGGTHGCWGSQWLDEDWDLLGRALGCTFGCQGRPWGGRALGTLGCWGPHWIGWALGTLGCWGSLWVSGLWDLHGRAWAAPLGARTHVGWVGVGSLWFGWHGGAPLGAKTPLLRVGVGFLWVLGSLWVGGHWGAPLGATDPMGWVGIGFLWVPLSWRAWGCTHGCWGPHGVGGCWVPLSAGSL